MGKTQVFPLDPSDFVRTRLPHSIEVATVAEGLAAQATRDVIVKKHTLTDQQQRAISKIAETCGLLHDIGNPPFGHAGELAIASWFGETTTGKEQISKLDTKSLPPAKDFLIFEGNAQTFRILTNTRLLAHDRGLNLTCATTSVARKYLAASTAADSKSDIHEIRKPGFFWSETEVFKRIAQCTSTQERRHPLTYLVEAADDIVYCVVDIEDGLKKHLLTWEQVHVYLDNRCSGFFRGIVANADKQMSGPTHDRHLRQSEYPQAFRVNAISAMVRAVVGTFESKYDLIMKGQYHKELLGDPDCAAAPFVKACKDLLRETVFRDQEVLRLEVRGRSVIHRLMDLFWEGVSWYLEKGELSTRTYGGKLYLLISDNYRHIFENRMKLSDGNELYYALQLVTDYVSGMTDAYACRLYKDLTNG
jgi:dGTPase